VCGGGGGGGGGRGGGGERGATISMIMITMLHEYTIYIRSP
jgi:hypothetical protein